MMLYQSSTADVGHSVQSACTGMVMLVHVMLCMSNNTASTANPHHLHGKLVEDTSHHHDGIPIYHDNHLQAVVHPCLSYILLVLNEVHVLDNGHTSALSGTTLSKCPYHPRFRQLSWSCQGSSIHSEIPKAGCLTPKGWQN